MFPEMGTVVEVGGKNPFAGVIPRAPEFLAIFTRVTPSPRIQAKATESS